LFTGQPLQRTSSTNQILIAAACGDSSSSLYSTALARDRIYARDQRQHPPVRLGVQAPLKPLKCRIEVQLRREPGSCAALRGRCVARPGMALLGCCHGG